MVAIVTAQRTNFTEMVPFFHSLAVHARIFMAGEETRLVYQSMVAIFTAQTTILAPSQMFLLLFIHTNVVRFMAR